MLTRQTKALGSGVIYAAIKADFIDVSKQEKLENVHRIVGTNDINSLKANLGGANDH